MLRRLRSHIALTALLILMLAGALASCGASGTGGQSGGTTSSKLDACALLTTAEIEAALGTALKAGEHGTEVAGNAQTATISQCRYDATSGSISASIFVRRSPVDDNSPSAIEAVRQTVKDLAHGQDPQPVSGVGDTAFWGAHQLNVFQGGNFYLIISVYGFDDEAVALEKAKTIAQKVLDRLKA